VRGAQKGYVRERLAGHLGKIPGVKVQIEQFATLEDAMKKEVNVIRRAKGEGWEGGVVGRESAGHPDFRLIHETGGQCPPYIFFAKRGCAGFLICHN
jgi:hypothetical protein